MLYAVSGGSLYDVTPTFNEDGNVTHRTVNASVRSGFANNRWRVAIINRHAFWVNGVDAPFQLQPAGTIADNHGLASEAAGFNANLLTDVLVFKNRLFFLEKGTARVFYGPIDAVQGSLNAFDLALVSDKGGTCAGFGTLSIDSGTGIDDLLCFFMSTGNMLLYKGTDPGTREAWQQIGEFNIGRVLGDRPLVKFGGDLLALTDNGLTSVLDLIRPRQGDFLRLSDKVQSLISQDAKLYGDRSDWQMIYHPQANWLMCHVPEQQGVAHQYVQNSQTGAWTIFDGFPVHCWEVFDRNVYFGGPDGAVHLADTGKSDGGNEIDAELITAKHLSLIHI